MATYIGIDLGSDRGSAVLVEYVDGKIASLRPLNMDDASDWAGIEADAVVVRERDTARGQGFTA